MSARPTDGAPTPPAALERDVTGPLPVASPNPLPTRLGVHVRDGGLDVAVVAGSATAVDLCVFPEGADGPEVRHRLLGPVGDTWHGHVPGLGVGTRYGFRVHGPWDPDGGLYHNPHKLLLDPYARGIEGRVDMGPEVHAHEVDADLYPTTYPMPPSSLDSAGHVPLSVVVDTAFPVAPKPRTAWEETVVYELHVRGFTMQMPGVPPRLRGTYAGLAHPASVAHLRSLGVTAVELLPVHAKCDETFLVDRGLTNYWGYSTLSWFAPEPSYASTEARARGAQGVVDEFRGMVSILHQAGIEVILDVVYNHTCEGGDAGPSLSWRGLDSALYYRHTDSRPQQMIDVTGCGNTVAVDNPRTMQMVLDSLRHWSREMGVDGFRFDLGATLGRLADGFTPRHPLLLAMAADEEIGSEKLIAEPWDIGPGGWQTGNFPAPFSEWNDAFRDCVRTFWLSDMRELAAGRGAQGPKHLATRLSGSQDVFGHGLGHARGPRASINFVTAHDGFTLADLTAFDHKHNTANLEGNRDGSNDNRSWNHGLEGAVSVNPGEGEPNDATGLVEDLFPSRQRSQRNMLATLLVASGTPMVLAGDEFQRTQYGNNNAYCQDGPISWCDWRLSPTQQDQIATVRWLLHLRRLLPAMRPSHFATGLMVEGDTIPDVSWFTATGTPMPTEAWSAQDARTFQMLRSGVAWGGRDVLVLINGTLTPRDVTLPEGHATGWLIAFDSDWLSPSEHGIDVDGAIASSCLPDSLTTVGARATVPLGAQSVVILVSESAPTPVVSAR